MGKFEQDAREMLEAIGGKENVAAVTHCATRMRFVLNDESKAEILHDREFGIVKTLKESEENFIKTGEKTVIAITGKGWETTMKVEGKNVPIKSDMKIVTENLY